MNMAAFFTHLAVAGLNRQAINNARLPIQSLIDPPATPGGVICDWSTNGALTKTSTGSAEALALDSSVLLDGVPALKCTFSTDASTTFIGQWVPTNPISLANFKSIQIPVKITNTGTGAVQGDLQVWLDTPSFKTVKLSMSLDDIPPGGQNTFSFTREASTGLVAFSGGATGWDALDSETVSKIRVVQVATSEMAPYPVWIGPIHADSRAVGRVAIVMDGQYTSQYTLIKPLLDKYGFKTSLALVSGDLAGGGARMSAVQVDEMYQQGHDVIHHTYDPNKVNGYSNETDWPTAASITADIRTAWNLFISKGWVRGLGVAVVGYSQSFYSTISATRQNLIYDALRAAGVRYYRRSTNKGAMQVPLGIRSVRPFMLRGAIQVTNTNTTADINAVVDQAANNGELAIITLHRAVADTATPGNLEMRVSDLDAAFAHMASLVAAGTLVVEPLGQVCNRFWPKN